MALVDLGDVAELMAFTDRLIDFLRLQISVADKEFVCTASVGIAFAPSDGDNATPLLRHADIALTRAKADGGPAHALLRARHGQGAPAAAHDRA